MLFIHFFTSELGVASGIHPRGAEISIQGYASQFPTEQWKVTNNPAGKDKLNHYAAMGAGERGRRHALKEYLTRYILGL